MRLHKTLIALGIAGALGAAAAVPAQADSLRFGNDNFSVRLHVDDGHRGHRGRHHLDRRHRDYRLPPRQVRRIVRRHGFHDISRPDYRPRRNVYVVRAENRRGRDVRVIVNARNGRIIDVDRLHRKGRHHGRHDGRHGGWKR